MITARLPSPPTTDITNVIQFGFLSIYFLASGRMGADPRNRVTRRADVLAST
jgi:hypothetical protein